MLKVAYIAVDNVEKPKKPTQKDLIHKLAMETLAVTKHEDRQKAKQMFQEEREYNRKLEIQLIELRKKVNLKH